MDVFSPKSNPWFAALEDVDDQMLLQDFVGDCLVDYPAEDMDMGALMDDDELQYTLSPGSECNSSTAAGEISKVGAKRQKKANEFPSSPNNNSNSNSNAESNGHSPVQQHLCLSPDETDTPPTTGANTKPTKRPRRLPDQCQNHIIAERQRRQNLSQRFIALSALIPGLKKMDKTSVLGEAITHMKQLKERVKILEEDKARRAVDSVVVVQRSRVVVENESNSSTSNDSSHSTGVTYDEQFPEVEARFSNRSVLIKIHCQMQIGLLSKIINKIENIHLSMEPAFDMAPQEVVENVRSIF
ncbi:hypothetical protein KSS87_003174 [Heliosperma pusillum]|nr:hypothetical protein KSS87_003174 [Heliosperma pusillum]